MMKVNHMIITNLFVLTRSHKVYLLNYLNHLNFSFHFVIKNLHLLIFHLFIIILLPLINQIILQLNFHLILQFVNQLILLLNLLDKVFILLLVLHLFNPHLLLLHFVLYLDFLLFILHLELLHFHLNLF